MRFSHGTREYNLKPGDWILIFEDGRVAGWTEAQTQEAIAWAESGGAIPMPEIV